MLFASLITVLFLAGSIERVTATEWEVLIHREESDVSDLRYSDSSEDPYVATDTPVEGTQPIEWYHTIERDQLFVYGEVVQKTNAKGVKVERKIKLQDRVDICVELNDGSWKDIVGQIVRQAWLPNASCDFEPGTYEITEPIGPLTLDIKEGLECGAYAFTLDLGDGSSVIWSKYIMEFTEVPSSC